jgi:hypothetical protein
LYSRGLILGLLIAVGLALVARADSPGFFQPLPYFLRSAPSNCPLSNCSIASGGVAQTVLNSNSQRKMFCISNPTSGLESLYFELGAAANVNSSLAVSAGGLLCMGGALIWQGSVSVNALTTGHPFGVEDFQ